MEDLTLPNLDTLRPASDPVLRRSAAPVRFDGHGSPLLPADFVGRMRQVMGESHGVGLAAPQIGHAIRVCVISWEGTELAWANPEVLRRSGAVRATEGCLSIPGAWFEVLRPTDVVVRAYDLDAGRWREFPLSGWLARIACHECDHLDGTLIDVAGVPEHPSLER